MPNSWFEFKQFRVNHDRCAMKVGTDGVLLGAWSPVEASDQQLLDIGTGSGLIALMLAQRNTNAFIDAIEIDEAACRQASENFLDSPWNSRMRAQHVSLQEYAGKCTTKYDLIVSNPPFFSHSLRAPDKSRTMARHSDTLSAEELLQHAVSLLNETGRICLILPVHEGYQCVKLAEKYDLFCRRMVRVFPKPEAEAKRLLLEFSFSESATQTTNLIIESETRHVYSGAFKSLVADFYLRLK